MELVQFDTLKVAKRLREAQFNEAQIDLIIELADAFTNSDFFLNAIKSFDQKAANEIKEILGLPVTPPS